MSVTVCLCVCLCVCAVVDFSAEDKPSGVKFRTAVCRRLLQGISHFCELCSTEAQNRTNQPTRHYLHDVQAPSSPDFDDAP